MTRAGRRFCLVAPLLVLLLAPWLVATAREPALIPERVEIAGMATASAS